MELGVRFCFRSKSKFEADNVNEVEEIRETIIESIVEVDKGDMQIDAKWVEKPAANRITEKWWLTGKVHH